MRVGAVLAAILAVLTLWAAPLATARAHAAMMARPADTMASMEGMARPQVEPRPCHEGAAAAACAIACALAGQLLPAREGEQPRPIRLGGVPAYPVLDRTAAGVVLDRSTPPPR